MRKNLKNYLLLAIFLILPTISFCMKRSRDSISSQDSNKKIKTEITQENKLSIPEIIKTDPVELKEHIDLVCLTYQNEIKELSRTIFKQFIESCVLTQKNCDLFIAEVKKLSEYKKFSSSPATFQQYIDNNISPQFIEKLGHNCRGNGICFSKINIIESSNGPEFSIQTPLYMQSPQNPHQFIFRPDILTLNGEQYKKHPDFFNICIVAAFRREIMRIVHIFNLFFQYQVTQAIERETKYLRCFSFDQLSQIYEKTNEQITFFMRNYGFRVGILNLTLRQRGIAQILERYLTMHPELCNRYGITQEDYLFFQNMKEIDNLKKQLLESEKSHDIPSTIKQEQDYNSNDVYKDMYKSEPSFSVDDFFS